MLYFSGTDACLFQKDKRQFLKTPSSFFTPGCFPDEHGSLWGYMLSFIGYFVFSMPVRAPLLQRGRWGRLLF